MPSQGRYQGNKNSLYPSKADRTVTPIQRGRPFKRVRRLWDNDKLKEVCEMHETDFADAYDMSEVQTDSGWQGSGDFYCFKDNGADVLFVGHLDTVVKHHQRQTSIVETAAGPVVHSGALDDRLGVYIGMHMLPDLGINVDQLLTTGEEDGNSSAAHFNVDFHFPGAEKKYDWIIEFDRGGTDVVMYQYDNWAMQKLVEDSGADTAHGAFSDISYMEHLETKAFNWGVGYHDYHSVRGYAYLWDTWKMVAHYLKFHAANAGLRMEHTPKPAAKYGSGRGSSSNWSGGGGGYLWGGGYDKRDDTPKGKTGSWVGGTYVEGGGGDKKFSGWEVGDVVDGWVFDGEKWGPLEEMKTGTDMADKVDSYMESVTGWVKVDGIWIQESTLTTDSERDRYDRWWLDQELG